MEFNIKSLCAGATLCRSLLGALCLALLPAVASAQDYQISMGDDYGAVVDDNGNLFVWGAITGGSGGVEQILPAEGWESVAVSRTSSTDAHFLAIRTNGTLWAWGKNDRGQLGDGTTTDRADPVQVSSATNWVEVAVGGQHSLARNSIGLVYAWGDNTFGQLNVTPIYNDPALDIRSSIPGQPIDFNAYISIAAGNSHSHAIRADGTLWAWGSGGSATNGGPELGILVDWDNNGHADDYPVGPVELTRVGTGSNWTMLFGGFDVTYALRDTVTETGQLWAWGAGGFIGNGQNSSILKVPTRIGTDSDWVFISRASSLGGGNPHALALKSDDTLWGWGSNYPDGQLGLPIYDGSGNPLPLSTISANSRRLSPVQLEAPDTFLAVGAGDGFSAVIRSDGFLLTAGANGLGQLANGSIDSTPETGQDSFQTSQLGVADIEATALNFEAGIPVPGGTFSGTFTVRNSGTGEITEDFQIAAVLSSSEVFNGIPLDFVGGLPELTVTDDLGAGDSLAIPFELEIPSSVPAGSYFFVLKADSSDPDLVVETNENNNTAASATKFDFSTDLIVPAGGLVVVNPPLSGDYDPNVGDSVDIELTIENAGSGTLPAGTEFDVRVFLSPDRSTTNSALVELEPEEPVVLASDLVSGATLPTLSLTYTLPRMPAGLFFVGVELDINMEVAEQPELRDDNDIVIQEDGEENNTAFTASLINVIGLTIIEAIDQDGSPLVFTTSGDGEWFGQTFYANNDGDAVQSPSLGVGEQATFSTSFSTPVAITFDWSAQTSSPQNRGFFRVVGGTTGSGNNEISGDTGGWIEGVARVIPLNARAEWGYEQGAEASGDAVYVDNLAFTEITAPDLVIDDMYLPEDATGTYVLLDEDGDLDLTINSRNQGTSTTVGSEYIISVYLSQDGIFDRPDGNVLTPDDILVHQEIVTAQHLGGDDSFTSVSIPSDKLLAAQSGNYYLIGYIDDYTDASGTLIPGKVSGSGEIAEFTGLVGSDPFPGEDNNLFISDSALIEILALPDLEVVSTSSVPNFYYLRDPLSGYVEPGNIPLSFRIENTGLASVNDPITIRALFSRNQVMEPESDYVVLDYVYDGSFGSVADAPANERFINPGAVDLRTNLVDSGYIGERLFLGVFADSGNDIVELNEDNNSGSALINNFIISERTIPDALDIPPSLLTDPNFDLEIRNDESAPYDDENIPWVGQTTETFDNVDAAASVRIGDNETSKFEIDLDAETGVRVSFWWKVSSQNELNAGVLQRDYLRFEVDGVAVVPDIFGTDNPNWSRVEVVLDSQPHTLTWSYVKDNDGSAGQDRGWVDALTITELPNLRVTGITVDGSLTYQAGDTIDQWSVEIVNEGDAIAPATEFDIEIRLLPNPAWAQAGSVQLLTITDDAGIAAGETRTYDQDSISSLTLPALEYAQEYYYLGAYVDWSLADTVNGQIFESNETDNSIVTDTSSIQIGRPDLVGDATSISGVDPLGYQFGDAVDLDIIFTNSGDGTLAAGSSFDYRVYIARTLDADEIGSASVVELGVGSVDVLANVASGDDLPVDAFSAPLPYGLSDGDYYLAVDIDVENDVEEQGLNPDNTGVDGEANNLFFTSFSIFEVNGIGLQVALDDGNSVIPLPTFEHVPESAAFWFGRDNDGDAGIEDDVLFEESEGAQTPVLEQGDFSAFTLTVADSSLVRFDWAAMSGSDLNELTVLVNDVEIASISGEVSLTEIDPPILVPAGGTVKWRYTKGAATNGDFALVDDVRIEDNDQPDLVLTALNYTPGEYVLDVAAILGSPNQLLGTEYLDITVEATNLGDDVVATSFTSSDLEVRLSIDREYGNADDIVLGTVNQVEGDLNSGNLLRFLGPIQLGDSIPAGSYYLIARIDSNDEVSEFSELNNMIISENRDVHISRLPALRIYNSAGTSEFYDRVVYTLDPTEDGGASYSFDIDENLRFYDEAPMRLRFAIQNKGLGIVSADQEWMTQINLRGIKRVDLDTATSSADLAGAVGPSLSLGSFSVQQLINGRSALNPEGGIIDIDIELALPTEERFNDSIDLPEFQLYDYLWFIEVLIDPAGDLAQSNIVEEGSSQVARSDSPWWILDYAEALDAGTTNSNIVGASDFSTSEDEGLFGIEYKNLGPATAAEWEALYPAYPTSNSDNLLAYAFYRNPAEGDTVGGQFPGTYGVTAFEGDEYLSIAFDIVTRATDLTYTVQVDDDPGFGSPDTLVFIDGPFDTLTGSSSLTGDGGLIEGYIDGPGGQPEEDNVISVLDQGYSARITVRDSQDTSVAPMRFIRVVVDEVP